MIRISLTPHLMVELMAQCSNETGIDFSGFRSKEIKSNSIRFADWLEMQGAIWASTSEAGESQTYLEFLTDQDAVYFRLRRM